PTKGWPNLQPTQVFGIPLTIDPAPVGPAWYAATKVNAWQPLPAPSIYSQVQKAAGDGLAIYPFTGGDSAGYVTTGQVFPIPGQAKMAGVDPIPGYLDFRGDQGAITAYNAKVVRKGDDRRALHVLVRARWSRRRPE